MLLTAFVDYCLIHGILSLVQELLRTVYRMSQHCGHNNGVTSSFVGKYIIDGILSVTQGLLGTAYLMSQNCVDNNSVTYVC